MEYVVHKQWSYFIGGSGGPTTQVKPFRYCALDYRDEEPGKDILVFCIVAHTNTLFIIYVHQNQLYV